MNYLILSDNSKAELKDFTASRLLLHNIDTNLTEKRKVDKITELRLGDEVTIEIKEKILVDVRGEERLYIVNHILPTVIKGSYILAEFIDNDSKFFLTPMYEGYSYDWLYNNQFVNVYLRVKNANWIYSNSDNVIYLMYRHDNSKEFLNFDSNLMSNKYYIDKYLSYNDDTRFVFYVMRIPDEFYYDVKLFKKGKYKEFSKLFKERIIKFHKLFLNSYVARVLNDDPLLRKEMEMELNCKIPSHLSLKTKPNKNKEVYG